MSFDGRAARVLSPYTDIDGVLDSLHSRQHVMEIFRRSPHLSDGPVRRNLDRLSNVPKTLALNLKRHIPKD